MSDSFFLIVGLILSAIGVLSIAGGIFSSNNCTEEIEGTVVSLKDKTHYFRGVTTHNITPVIRYSYQGQTYESKADLSTTDTSKYSVGGSVTILVNPNRPEEYRTGATAFPYVFGLLTLLPGAVLIFCYFL